MSERFKGLTEAQFKAFGAITINQEPCCKPETIQALIDKGLIIEHKVKMFSRKGNSLFDLIPITVKRYEVPMGIHIEWCDWCTGGRNK